MYLRRKDYDRFIQSDTLSQALSQDDTIRTLSEDAAREEIESYLKSKYDTDAEFTDTLTYENDGIYTQGSRVDFSFPPYDKTKDYTTGDLCTVLGASFKANATFSAEDFTAAHWDRVGTENDMYFLKPVYPDFKLDTPYKVGEVVYFEGKIYKCLVATSPITHEGRLQAGTRSNVPHVNAVPGVDTTQWSAGVEYAITNVFPKGFASSPFDPLAGGWFVGDIVKYNNEYYLCIKDGGGGIYPDTDITRWLKFAWLKGDNRSQQIVMIMIDITLFHLHSRISPKNVPDVRQMRYEACIGWLKKANLGNLTPKLKLLQPNTGSMIRYGGPVKTTNSY